MGVADRRRAPFCWLELAALERIALNVADGQRAGVRNVYLALAELAAERLDGKHEGFEAARSAIATRAGVSSKRTVDAHVATLEVLALVRIEQRTDEHNRPLSSLYVLTSPEAGFSGGATVAPPPDGASNAPQGAAGSPQIAPPTRAGEPVSKNEEERESERAQTDIPLGGGLDDLESAVVAELEAIAADRGITLDVPAVQAAIGEHKAAVDVLAAARRVRGQYTGTGKAANRRIATLAGLYRSELIQSSADSSRGRGRRKKRSSTNAGPGYTGTGRRTPSRVHEQPPAALTVPGPPLEAAWQRMRAELKRATNESTWHLWLEPLELAGRMVDGDRRVVYLNAPADKAAWVDGRFMRLIDATAERVLGTGVRVELILTAARSEAA